MSLAEDEVERLAAILLRDFGGRHHNYHALLRRHASIVSAHIEEARELTAARTLLLGATFTAEYATEAAALCNPSAVLGPDQGGLRAGQARVALSVRGIGEGYISSIGFCSAVVGPGAQWTFEPRLLPVSVADTTPASWRRARLLISSDLRVFRAHRLAGPAARNKGMALFPRKVNGQHLALCRSDGESTSLAGSADGYVWDRPVVLQEPSAPWEMLQVGNCGPPIETDQGWLVLTHGVGPMRVYVIGTLLLDLDDPTRVVGYSRTPLLSPGREEQDGYVPNVVYSCGAFMHDDLLWIPYGIDDCRIGVAYAPLGEVLADMSRVSYVRR
jgi:hypothetical protein